MKSRILGWLVLLTVLAMGVGFAIGYNYPHPEPMPTSWNGGDLYFDKAEGYITLNSTPPQFEVIEKPVYIDRPVYQVIEKPIIIEQEKIIYEPIYSRQWQTIDEFKSWCATENFTYLWYVGDQLANCVSYATRLQVMALEQGYSVSTALARGGYYYGVKVCEGNHAGNLVLIGNTYYWVEPQPDKFELIKLVEVNR